MSLVRSHVEQTLCFTKTSSDVVTSLIGISVVDLGQLGVVADQQQRGGNANNGT